jgi:hypothetical protein
MRLLGAKSDSSMEFGLQSASQRGGGTKRSADKRNWAAEDYIWPGGGASEKVMKTPLQNFRWKRQTHCRRKIPSIPPTKSRLRATVIQFTDYTE